MTDPDDPRIEVAEDRRDHGRPDDHERHLGRYENHHIYREQQ